MEKKKPRHLTASGQIKPSVRLARRNVAKDCRVPTYLSAALFNRFQEEVARSLYSASSLTSVTSTPASERLRQEVGSAPSQHNDELGGVDWRETLKQRAIEIERFNQLGMALPAWAREQSPNQSEQVEPSGKASHIDLLVRNVRFDIAMFLAVKHGCKSFLLILKKGFYASGHAVCTQVYGLVRRIERMLGAIHDGSLGVSMQFVLVKVRRLFFQLSQFLFELTFAIGQRRLLLLEREALILDVKHPVIHVANDLDD